MKPRCSNQRNQALTITEVLVTVVAVCLLALVALAQSEDSRAKAQNDNCVNHLKQIGLAFRIWAGDNGGKYPMHVPARGGGVKELVVKGNAVACFQVMSNELSTPKVLICAADTGRSAATYFTKGFDNSKVSYFIGVDADERKPQMFLSGDDNFAVGGVPVKPGLLGIKANQPITWTTARHVHQGNILLSDGSVQTVTIAGLTKLLQQTGVATNRLAIP